jgi:hypothetical protein
MLSGKERRAITIQKSTFFTKEGITAGLVGLILSGNEM